MDEKQSQHQNVSDTLHCTVNMLFSRLNAARGVIKVFVIRVRRLFENLFYSFLYSYFVFVVKDDKQKIALMKVYKEKRKHRCLLRT